MAVERTGFFSETRSPPQGHWSPTLLPCRRSPRSALGLAPRACLASAELLGRVVSQKGYRAVSEELPPPSFPPALSIHLSTYLPTYLPTSQTRITHPASALRARDPPRRALPARPPVEALRSDAPAAPGADAPAGRRRTLVCRAQGGTSSLLHATAFVSQRVPPLHTKKGRGGGRGGRREGEGDAFRGDESSPHTRAPQPRRQAPGGPARTSARAHRCGRAGRSPGRVEARLSPLPRFLSSANILRCMSYS